MMRVAFVVRYPCSNNNIIINEFMFLSQNMM